MSDARRLTVLCLAVWLIFLWLVVPVLTPLLPAWWWLDVRAVRVDGQTQVVTIDRDIHAGWWDKRSKDGNRYWLGNVQVHVRQISGTMVEDVPSSCRPQGRQGIRYFGGASYPAGGRTLAWFMDSPPNQGCDLQPGAYVADFEWTRTFLHLPLRTRISSTIFTVPEQSAQAAP